MSREEQQFFEDPAVDRLMGVLMALATEHWVLRDRVKTLERLLSESGGIDIDSLGAAPSEEDKAAAQAEAAVFARELLRPLLGEQQSVGATGRFSMKDV